MSERILESNTTNAPLSDDDRFDIYETRVRRREREARERLEKLDEGLQREAAKRALKKARRARRKADGERRQKYLATVSPSLVVPRSSAGIDGLSEQQLQDLHTAELSPEEQQIYLDIINEGIGYQRPGSGRRFAQLAIQAVFGDADNAKFLDDFLWYHMGDPIQIGHNKPKNPWVDDGLSEDGYGYDYSHTLLNGYVEGDESDITREDKGHLIHVRETYEQGTPNIKRYLVILGNIATREVNEFHINEVNVEENATRLWVTTERLGSISGKLPSATKSAKSILHRAEEVRARQAAHDRQAYVQLSNQTALFKRFSGQVQEISPIINVVRDRLLLTRLAAAAGVVNDAGEAIRVPDYLSERSA